MTRTLAATCLVAGLLMLPRCHGAEAPPGEQGKTGPAVEARAVLPQPDLPYPALEGRTLFEHYCVVCHGAEGHGDGFNSYNLDPKPRDLADPAFQKSRTDDDLAAVIRTGGGAAGLSTGMPPWRPALGERQFGDLVLYIRTLGEDAAKQPPSD